MTSAFNDEINSFAERISSAKEDVRYADAISLNPNKTSKNQAARIKSSIIIQVSASFENFLSLLIEKLNLELSNAKISLSEIHPSLLSIELNNIFSSLKTTEGMKNWEKRVELLSKIHSSDSASIPSSISIFGAKTPRKKHLILLWDIYSIQLPLSPTPAHLLALDSLADSRNQIAHGELCATSAGKNKTTLDLENIIKKIEELGLHIACCFELYLKQEKYKKVTP
ncbi:HEPN domain-containing protein [Pseudomonas chlororaphis]|uniref:HEPN domain-containing protein n=1 Tax=Pseudomonas chlororaphis TaxID=587753 RepID=UPI00117B7B8B|nr:HEPN domain-containing protein [Pseudomonas chlororaphis]